MVALKRRRRVIDKLRVLIAEDYLDTLNALRKVFEKAGWDVVAAEDGREALYLYHQAIHEGRYFDVLLLDVEMPRLNGFAVGVNVRNLEKFGEVPRAIHIYLTGHDDLVPPEDLLSTLFADDYVRKPFDFFELLSRAEKLVNARRNPF